VKKAGRLGSWEAGRLGGWEAGMLAIIKQLSTKQTSTINCQYDVAMRV